MNSLSETTGEGSGAQALYNFNQNTRPLPHSPSYLISQNYATFPTARVNGSEFLIRKEIDPVK
jgi:hypothetical protein